MTTPRRQLLLSVAAATAIGLAAPTALAAAGWGAVLGQGPTLDYNDEDLRLLLDAIRQVLDAPGEPVPVEWRNPQSGAGGTLLVVGRPKLKGHDECRRVRAALHSKKRSGTPVQWTACREAGGRWLLVGAG
jgi:surface antigen